MRIDHRQLLKTDTVCVCVCVCARARVDVVNLDILKGSIAAGLYFRDFLEEPKPTGEFFDRRFTHKLTNPQQSEKY